ncbi:hypothetical protein BON30_20930 [Cystobacter ferrugineus]|uniref:Ankryin n=2 Tax=Cystobacter ferrugineus TaxID=83449 RepID=A0A1L9B8W9_9BACT|nr:hypothetical protein BON30_20930 [Cystobacter ferrugineus]
MAVVVLLSCKGESPRAVDDSDKPAKVQAGSTTSVADTKPGEPSGHSLVRAALASGDAEALKALVAQADEARVKELGLTEAHVAVLRNDRKQLAALLKDPARIPPSDSLGMGLLHYAALAAEPRTVDVLLDADGVVDPRNRADRTPLMLAAERGRADMVAHLLERGASVNAEDAGLRSALNLALEGSHNEVVSLLLEKGAVLSRRKLIAEAPEKLRPQLEQAHRRFLLRWAVDTGYLSRVAALVRQGATDARTEKLLQLTPFHLAAIENSPAKLEALAEKDAQLLERLHEEQRLSPLHWAALAGAEESTAWLISRSFDVHARASINGSELSAFDIAVQEGHVAVAQRLVAQGAVTGSVMPRVVFGEQMREVLSRASLNARLREAWAEGRLAEFPALLREGATPAALASSGPPTPLHWSVLRGEPLSSATEAELKAIAADAQGRSLLHYAALSSNGSVLGALLELHPDVNVRDARGATALHDAASVGDAAAIRRLVQAGADLNLSATGTLGDEKQELTPVMAATLRGNVPAVRALLDAGANLGFQNQHGNTALSLALCEEQVEVTELLLERSAPVEGKSRCWEKATRAAINAGEEELALKLVERWKEPPPKGPVQLLGLAARHNQAKLLRHLLSLSGVPRDEMRGELLLTAARNGARASVELLLEGGAPLVPAQVMERALQVAATAGHSEVAALLLERGADPMWKPEEGETAVVLMLAGGLEKALGVLAAKHPQRWASIQTDPSYLVPAIRGGQLELVRGYIEAGADPKGSAPNGGLLLAEVSTEAMASYLLDHGAWPDFKTRSAATGADAGSDSSGDSYWDPFSVAVRKARFDIARLLIRRGAQPSPAWISWFLDHTRPQQIMDGIWTRPRTQPEQFEQLRVLLQEPAWTQKDILQVMAHSAAVLCERLPIFEVLLERLSPEDIKSRSREVIARLAECRDTRALELLVGRGVELNALDGDGLNVLENALRRSAHRAPWVLLRLGVRAIPAREDKLTYVWHALHADLHDVARELLDRIALDGALDDAKDPDELLLMAMRLGASDAAARLIAQGGNPHEEGNNDDTALSYALQYGWRWGAELLIQLNASDPKARALDMLVKAEDWSLARQLAIHGGVPSSALAYRLEESHLMGILRHFVLSRPERLDGDARSTLLSHATRENDLELLRLLLVRLGADGDLPLNPLLLHTAVPESKLAIVELLVEHGADVNADGPDCSSPLREARDRKSPEGRRIAKYLESRGATIRECEGPGPQ